MGGTHHGEVTHVDGGDLGDPKPFGGSDHRGVDRSERKVVVPRDELGDALDVGGVKRLQGEIAVRQVAQEADLRLPTEPRADQMRDLGDDEHRYDQRSGVSLEQLETAVVMGIVRVDVRVERAGVDDQRDPALSALMISSMRSEMSLRPLCPAARARSRRRPDPRCSSSASRVTSAIVTPRR